MVYPIHKSKKCLFTLVLPLLFFSFSFLSAQSTIESIENYGIQEGLSNRIISDMIIDSRGLLWCATTSGLNLYDGYSFSKFLLSSDTDFRINGNNIIDIEELDDSQILIRYEFNLEFVDSYNFRLGKTQKIPLNASTGVKGQVLDIGFQKMGDLFVLSSDSDSIYLAQKNESSSFSQIFSLPLKVKLEENDFSLYPSPKGKIWINNSAIGLYCIDENGEEDHFYSANDFETEDKHWSYPNEIEMMHEDQSGNMWFIFKNRQGVYTSSNQRKIFKSYDSVPVDKMYSEIWEDQSGNLFFGTREVHTTLDELYCLRKDGQVETLNYLLENDPLVLCLLANDLDDYIFFGTYNGLNRIKFRNKNIQNYLDTIPGYWGKTIKGITGDGKNKIFFAKETEWWYQLDMATGGIDTLKVLDSQTGKLLEIRNCTQLVYEDDHLWGTYLDTTEQKGYLVDMNLETQKSLSYIYPQEIKSLMKSEGELWMVVGTKGETGKLVNFDFISKTFSEELDFSVTQLKPYADPTFLHQGKDGVFWIGTTNGLLSYDRLTKRQTVFTTNRKTGEGLNNDNIIFIREHEDGLIYIGTFGGGINVLDPKTGKVKHWDSSDGLVNNEVCSIFPADDDNFWVTTFNGLSYWDRKNNGFRNYFIKDGLSHNEFNRFSFYQHSTGEYFFGNLNGVSSFKTENLLEEEENHPLCLTRLAIYNSRKNKLSKKYAGLDGLEEIVLSPYDSYFEINFTLPEFDQPEKHQYYARLEGLESEWTFLRSTPYVRYNTLEAGNYVLHLKGSTSSGDLSSSSMQINVSVKKIFYKTWWFFILLLLLAAAIIYSYYKFRLQRLVEVERLRTKIASDLHDEVGGIMTRISMGSDILQEGFYSPEEQKRELKNIAAQSRAATSIMRDVVWSIDARQDKVRNLLDRMQDQLTELLLLAEIEFKMDTNGMLPNKDLDVDVRQNIYFIFKEAINNTVKHSNATVINVYLENTRSEFIMKIKDNGTNEIVSEQNTNGGQGLKNIKMRAKRLNAVVRINKINGYEIIVKRKPLW